MTMKMINVIIYVHIFRDRSVEAVYFEYNIRYKLAGGKQWVRLKVSG